MPGGTVNANVPDASVSPLTSAGPEIATLAPASGAPPDVLTVPVIVAVVPGGGVEGTGSAVAGATGAGVGSAPLAPAGTVVINIQRIAAAHAPRFPVKYVIKCLDINGKTARA
jgi:hypothetical protein